MSRIRRVIDEKLPGKNAQSKIDFEVYIGDNRIIAEMKNEESEYESFFFAI